MNDSVDVSASTAGSTSSRTGRGGGNETIQVVCRFRPARETDPFAWFDASRESVSTDVSVWAGLDPKAY